ncbi:hypothetical protein EUTSA_v10001850mg [Eutrema salsugineum]|uniref:F-box domain-containing protein n=1 Tax=Eutrema salsugineum TaxID=72664 RepID=V4L5D8_EUTSA|nr:hypothetical protein EUTSA_v10001850mg [Eutrema salsugineum]
MVDRRKSNQARFKGLSKDKTSELPDPLICQILCHLPTKDVVRTSVLSTRWRNLSTFVIFGDRFFYSSRASCIDKLKLTISGNEDNVDVASSFTSSLDAVVKRKIQDLYVICLAKSYEMPPSIFNCETLVSLKLNFEPFASAEFVSLPCLKTLDLEYPNEAIFGRLVSSCPVLEELNIVIFAIVRVLSKSLKSLSICILFSCSAGVVIDAPQLDRLRSFLPVISNIRDMTVSENTFKLFYQYSKFEPFPQFGNMSRLHVTLCVSNLIWLPNFLESCPNLKSLTMFVELKDPNRGYVAEMELIRYFLTNSVILKTLTLCLDSSSSKDDIFKKLLKIPRGSTECEVLIL